MAEETKPDYANAGNLLKNTDPDARAKIAAVFGGKKPEEKSGMDAMKRRMGQ